MPPTSRPTPEDLLAQTAWVGRLSLALTGDPERGGDLAQDAWVAALERPPHLDGEGHSLRAWLWTVLRNGEYRQRRETARRETRERAVARPESLPAVDQLLAQEEARAELVREVLALAEPERTAVLLRYFQQLPAAEIARRLEVPASTVRNRVRRGLSKLRDTLERQHADDWRTWCLTMAPAGALTSPGALSTAPLSTGVLMSAKANFVAGVVVVALGATILTWRPWSSVPPSGLDEPTSTALVAQALDLEPLAGPALEQNQPTREPVDVEDADERAGPVGAGTILYGSVSTLDGEPVTDGHLWISDSAGTIHRASLDGRAAYSLTELAQGNWTLGVGASGYLPLEEPVAIEAGSATLRHDLTLSPSWTLVIKVVGEDGTLIRGDEQTDARLMDARLVAVATEDPPGDTLPLSTSRDHAHYGVGIYTGRSMWGGADEDAIPEDATGLLEVRSQESVHVSLAMRHLVLATQLVHPGQTEVVFEVEGDPVTDSLGTVRARIVDAVTGAPLVGARASLSTSQTGGGGRVVDADGVIEFESVMPGWMELEVRAPDHEFFRELVVVEPGTVTDLGEVPVRSAVTIAGRVVDEEGVGVGTSLSYVPLHLVDCPEAFGFRFGLQSKADGAFELQGAARGRVLLHTRGEWAVNGTVIDASRGDVRDVEILLRRGRQVTLEFEVEQRSRYDWLVRERDGDPVAAGAVSRSELSNLRLVDGSYRLELWEADTFLVAADFEVAEDGARATLKY